MKKEIEETIKDRQFSSECVKMSWTSTQVTSSAARRENQDPYTCLFVGKHHLVRCGANLTPQDIQSDIYGVNTGIQGKADIFSSVRAFRGISSEHSFQSPTFDYSCQTAK